MVNSLYDDYDKKHIDDISLEYGRLMDWFNKDFPEASIRLDVHQDKIKKELRYRLSVLSGKTMTPKEQLFIDNTIVITPERFLNPIWMERFKSSIYPNYKKEIIRRMNEWYAAKKDLI